MSVFQAILGGVQASLPFIGGPWRPPQQGQPAVYSMTCTLPSSSTTGGTAQQPTTFFFDAVLRAEHVQELVVTKHPVQVGPAIVDHAYLQPARVVLEIGMSDAMASLVASQYSSSPSKSVSAYQTFKQIQAARVPITLSTRLDSYKNMVITDVRGIEDSHTSRSFRGTIYFEQIISATVTSVSTSDRPNQTGATNEGTKAPTPTSPTENSGILNTPLF